MYFIGKLSLWTYQTKKNIREHKHLILLETDHQELLKTCRMILQNSVNETYLKESDWPNTIINLNPSFVMINSEKQYIDIVFGGGFYMFGVIAFKEGVGISLNENNENTEDYHYKQLIDGLWFYEE